MISTSLPRWSSTAGFLRRHARTIGVEKTRLSRRIAALEKRLGVRLLQRTTRALALTEAGQRFFERCVATVEGAQAAYDSVADDLRVRLQAAIHGIGIALLPEQVVSGPLKEKLIERVLSEWSGDKNILHLVYPTPRGMLPSVRSLIDYLLIHVPAWLQERSIQKG